LHPAYIWGFPTSRFVRFKVHLFNRPAKAETQAQPASQALKQTRKPAARAVYISCRLLFPGRIGATNNFPKGKDMNLRRTFLALGAMILGVGLFGAFPQPAQAAVVACTATDPGQTQYPYGQWSMRCGSITAAEGQQMSTLVNQLTGQTKQEHKRANNGNLPDASARPLNGTRFFLFANPQDYIDSAASLGLTLVPFTPALDADDYAFSVVHFDANKVPVYVAVFKTNKVGRTFTNAIRNGTATGAARGADYLQGFIKNGGIQPPVNYRLSDTGAGFRAMFEKMVDRDYQGINALQPCNNGFFSGYSDKDGVYICNGTNGNGPALSATYAGLNNRAVLNKAWPHIYPAVPAGGPGTAAAGYYAGFFAEIYAARATNGAADNIGSGKTQDIYFAGNTNFACSRWFVQNIPNQGFLDNTALPAACSAAPSVDPTLLMTTKCRKLFAATGGQFPNGNVFNCTNPSTAIAQEVQIKLNGLGRLGAPAQEVTNIKSEFSRIRAQVFLFTDAAAYTAAFTAAGEPNPSLVGTVAGTYPNSTMWYTIVLGTFFANSGEAAYTTTHELGHAFDWRPTQQSSLASYDLAMQHDWLTLDYVAFPGTVRNPCGTVALNGYTGPLIGVQDPSSGNAQFCNGNVIVPKWAGKKTSEILRDPTVYGQASAPPKYQAAAGTLGYNPGVNRLAGWREWHAEAFAIRAKTDVVTTPVVAIYSQMVTNGYFACTAGPASWAQTEYTTGAAVAVPPCQGAMPGGWVTIH